MNERLLWLSTLAACAAIPRLMRCFLTGLALLSIIAVPPVNAQAANPTDPRIVALANSLGNSPANIHTYLRDQIGVEIYAGSLRGGRGTLASKAGNSLDRASLGVALLRASGFTTARYARGVLPTNTIYAMISRMVAKNPLRVLGCDFPGGVSRPEAEYDLFVVAEQHFWIEYESSPGVFTAIDGSFAGAILGQTLTTATSTFTDIPVVLRHKVRLSLDVETYLQAAAAFGLGIGSSTVLDRTFDTVDVVDKPITLGHFLGLGAPPALAIGATTNTYSPYLVVGDATFDPLAYEVIRGTDYTEIFTNFPLGNIVVTGITLNMDITDANGATTRESRTLADRIGFVNRRSGATVAVNTGLGTQPLLTQLDQMTIGINPGRQPLDDFAQRRSRLLSLQTQLASLAPIIAAMPAYSLRTPTQVAQTQQAIALNTAAVTLLNELSVASMAGAADVAGDRQASRFLVKAYQVSPRITIATTKTTPTGLRFGLDLRRNDRGVVVAISALPRVNLFQFRHAVGLAESMLEGEILNRVTGAPGISIASIFSGAPVGTDFFPITSDNREDVERLNLSAEAKARILDAVANRRAVIAPTNPVLVSGIPVTGWLETDPSTGFTISTFEDGTHGGIAEYVLNLALSQLGDPIMDQMGGFIGQVNGFGVVAVAFTAAILDAIATGLPFSEINLSIEQSLAIVMKGAMDRMFKTLDDLGLFEISIEGRGGLVISLIKGLKDGIENFAKMLKAESGDPPTPDTLFSMDSPPLPALQPPGAVAGVAISAALDPLFSRRFGGAEFAGVYRVRITNTGPIGDTFRFAGNGNGAYGVDTTIAAPPFAIPAGATAEVHACIKPGFAVPPVGSAINSTLVVFSTSNNAVTATVTPTLSTPATTALLLKILPTPQSKLPGASGSATLTLDSLGNQATSTTLTVTTSPNLSVSGVPGSVTLAAGESRSFPINYSVSGGAVPGSTLSLDVRGNFGGAYPADAQLGVYVTSAITTCAAPVAMAAQQVGREALGATLARLANDMDRLAGSPTDVPRKQAVLADLDALLPQLNAPFINASITPVTNARSSLSSATSAGVGAVLGALDTALCGLNTSLRAAHANGWRLVLNPAVTTNLPTLATTLDVNILNDTAVPRVFDLTVLGVPVGTSGSFSPPTVTVPANYRTNGFASPVLNLTFTNIDGAAKAFDYQVVATPRDDPSAAKSASGRLTLSPEIIRVASVAAVPAYGNPGTLITVTPRLLNAVNRTRDVYVRYQVKRKTGQVVYQVDSALFTLNPGDNVLSVAVPVLNTTGFSLGTYRIEAFVFDPSGTPINGAAGSTDVLIGQPLGASLTATPSVVLPGNSTVSMALTLDRASAVQPLLTLRGSGSLPGLAVSFAQSGALLYACQEDRVSIINISNPAAPTVLSSFATAILTPSYRNVTCTVSSGKLILGFDLDSPTSGSTRKLVVFDISGANATAPAQLTPTPIDLVKRFGGSIVFDGNTGYMNTANVTYNPFSQFIFQQNGNLLKLDFTNAAAPTLIGELFHHFPLPSTDTNDPILGGANMHFGVPLVRGSKALIASTTSTLGDVHLGVGRVQVVDTASLNTNCPGAPNPCLGAPVDVPEARVLYGIAGQGNAAVATGDTLGFYDALSGFTGNLTVTALNVTTPTAPTISSTLVTALGQNETYTCNPAQRKGAGTLTALTANFYATSAYNPQSCSFVLAIIDANDPANLRVIPYDVPDILKQVILDGNVLYALTATSVVTFDYATITGPSVVAKVDVPKNTGVAVVPGSFNLAPTSTVSAADRDTLIWNQPLTSLITWQETISNMQPGSSRDVALATRIDFVVAGLGNGTLNLGPTAVTSSQAISISPVLRYVAIGSPATFTLTLTNPTAAAISYDLTVHGVPAAWVQQVDSPVNVPANGTATATLVLQTPIGVGPAEIPFTVTATSNTNFVANVTASFFNYSNPDLGVEILTPTISSPVTVTPSPATGARGVNVVITLRVNNNGSLHEDYFFVPQVLPNNWNAVFDRPNAFVAPGASADFRATVSIPAAEVVGSQNVVFRLYANNGIRSDSTVPVNVLGAGVTLVVSPGSGSTSTAYVFNVVNVGTASDTFDLVAYGPLGGAVTLSASVVTLAPGASSTVTATIANAASFTLPGISSFEVQAVSRTSTAARARATAQVTVGSALGLNARISPASAVITSTPSTASTRIIVDNTGNAEDSYSVTIRSISGPATASLQNGSNSAAQSISPMRALAFGSAAVTLNATLNATGIAVVTVRVQSLTDSNLFRDATFTLSQTVVPVAVISLSSSALTFAGQTVATSSAVQTVTLTNAGNTPLAISSLGLTGAQSSDFALSGSCSTATPVAASGNCTISVIFTPGAVGSRSASVSIASNATVSPASVALSGNGIAPLSPAVSLSSTSVTFGTQLVGTTSATQTVTLTNSGTAPLSLSALAITGTNAGDFNRSGTCSTATPVPAAGTCTLIVSFSPIATGGRAASVNITSNATASPHSIALGGTGTTPTTCVTGTLATGGNATACISGGGVSCQIASGSFVASSTVTTPLPTNVTLPFGLFNLTASGCTVGGTITLNVTYPTAVDPAAQYYKFGRTITNQSPHWYALPALISGNSISVSLTDGGTGDDDLLANGSIVDPGGAGVLGAVVPTVPILSLSAATLAFGNQTVGTASAAQTVTVTNTGSAPLAISSLGVTGVQSSDFALSGSCSTIAPLAASASCTLRVIFTPGALGSRSASISIASNAAGSPVSIGLTGTGITPATPTITLAPATLTFASQQVATTSASQTVTLTNSGTATLNLTSLAIVGINAADYILSGSCAASTAVAASSSCTLIVSFRPSAEGARLATISVVSNAAGSPHSVNLSGIGAAVVAIPTALPVPALSAIAVSLLTLLLLGYPWWLRRRVRSTGERGVDRS